MKRAIAIGLCGLLTAAMLTGFAYSPVAASGNRISGEVSAIADNTVTLKLFVSGEKPPVKANPQAAKKREAEKTSKVLKAKPIAKAGALPKTKNGRIKGAPQTFSGEVKTIAINAGTSIVLSTGNKAGRVETAIELSAVKAGWTLSICYEADGTTIQKIIAHDTAAQGSNG